MSDQSDQANQSSQSDQPTQPGQATQPSQPSQAPTDVQLTAFITAPTFSSELSDALVQKIKSLRARLKPAQEALHQAANEYQRLVAIHDDAIDDLRTALVGKL